MKYRWKLFIATVGLSGMAALGAYYATPTSADAAISAEQKAQIVMMNEINGDIARLVPKLDPGVRDIYTESIWRYSKENKLDPCLVVSVNYRESGFNAMATSSAGCVGPMQVNPKAHAERVKYLKPDELYFIDNNIKIGCSILKEYYVKGKVREALKRYVGGDHPTYINDVLSTYAVLKLDKGEG